MDLKANSKILRNCQSSLHVCMHRSKGGFGGLHPPDKRQSGFGRFALRQKTTEGKLLVLSCIKASLSKIIYLDSKLLCSTFKHTYISPRYAKRLQWLCIAPTTECKHVSLILWFELWKMNFHALNNFQNSGERCMYLCTLNHSLKWRNSGQFTEGFLTLRLVVYLTS